jgi:CRISPR-associated protein Csm3
MTASTKQKPLLGKFFITSRLVVETGLHIGGGGESLDIGGLDKPVIRDPLTRRPYLPGSSIKGKLRSILERLEGKPVNRKGAGIYRYESDDLEDGYTEIDRQVIKFIGARTCPVSRIFGSTGVNCWVKTSLVKAQGLEPVNNPPRTRNDLEGNENYTYVKGRNSPARLIVRDCHLRDSSAEKLENINTGLYMTEWKFENGLDRITAAANPRQIERVPSGSEFNFELVYTVEDEDLNQARHDLKNLLCAILILEDDALGGHGSRGYGKVKFQNLEFCYRNYQGISGKESSSLTLPSHTKLSSPVENTSKLPERFSQIQGLLPQNGSAG